MKIYTYLLIIPIAFFYCKGDDIDKTPIECVINEVITSQDSTFVVNSPGKMEYGYANAIKLNKPWQASANALFYKDTFYINFNTYLDFPNDPDLEYNTEYISIQIANLQESCMKLSRMTSNNSCKMS